MRTRARDETDDYGGEGVCIKMHADDESEREKSTPKVTCTKHSSRTRKTDVSRGEGVGGVQLLLDVLACITPNPSISRRGDVPYPPAELTISFAHDPGEPLLRMLTNPFLLFSDLHCSRSSAEHGFVCDAPDERPKNKTAQIM